MDEAGARYAAGNSLTRILRRLQQNPQDSETLERANVLTSLYPMMPFSVDCWHAQNIYYSILDKVFPGSRAKTIRHRASGRNAFLPWEKNSDQRSRAGAGNRIEECKLKSQIGQSNEKSDKSYHWQRCRGYAHGGRGGGLRNSYGAPERTQEVSRASPARVAWADRADYRGSRGLGLALAEEFAQFGAKIAICARDEQELARARQQLEELGAVVCAVPAT